MEFRSNSKVKGGENVSQEPPQIELKSYGNGMVQIRTPDGSASSAVLVTSPEETSRKRVG